MSEKVSEFTERGSTIELYIEDYEHPDDLELGEEVHTLTDVYEIVTRDGTLYRHLSHSIKEVEGTCFRIEPDAGDTCTLEFVSIMTRRDDDGEVVVPDMPLDEGSIEVEAGEYHMWDTYEFSFES